MARQDALHVTMMEQAAADRQLFAASPTNASGPPLRMQEYEYPMLQASILRGQWLIYILQDV